MRLTITGEGNNMQTQTLTPIQEQIEIVGRQLSRLCNSRWNKFTKERYENLLSTLRVLQAQRKAEENKLT